MALGMGGENGGARGGAHVHHGNANIRDHAFAAALAAEFVGVALFQLLGCTVADTPLKTGLTFAALLYGVRHISGGNLNPAVSLAGIGSGHLAWSRGLLYIVAQVLGALVGALLQAALVPGVKVFHHFPAACLAPQSHVLRSELFGWETILTFFFIMVMYAAIFVEPSHGDAGPLAGGLAVYAVTSTGGAFTGHSPVNPARLIASTLIFNCAWRWSYVYLLAQLLGSGLAILAVHAVYGRGEYFYSNRQGRGEQLRESLMP